MIQGLDKLNLDEIIGDIAAEFRDAIELVRGTPYNLYHEAYLKGELTQDFLF